MVTLTATGPFGAIMAVGQINVTIHGVSARIVKNGKLTANGGHGEGQAVLFYINGKRVSRAKAMDHLNDHITEGEKMVITGSFQ